MITQKKCGFMGTQNTLFTALLCLAYVVSESPSLAMHSSGLRMFALCFLLLAVQTLCLASVAHTRGLWVSSRLGRTWRKNIIPSVLPPAMTNASSLCFPFLSSQVLQVSPLLPELSVFLPLGDQLCQHTEWLCYL